MLLLRALACAALLLGFALAPALSQAGCDWPELCGSGSSDPSDGTDVSTTLAEWESCIEGASGPTHCRLAAGTYTTSTQISLSCVDDGTSDFVRADGPGAIIQLTGSTNDINLISWNYQSKNCVVYFGPITLADAGTGENNAVLFFEMSDDALNGAGTMTMVADGVNINHPASLSSEQQTGDAQIRLESKTGSADRSHAVVLRWVGGGVINAGDRTIGSETQDPMIDLPDFTDGTGFHAETFRLHFVDGEMWGSNSNETAPPKCFNWEGVPNSSNASRGEAFFGSAAKIINCDGFYSSFPITLEGPQLQSLGETGGSWFDLGDVDATTPAYLKGTATITRNDGSGDTFLFARNVRNVMFDLHFAQQGNSGQCGDLLDGGGILIDAPASLTSNERLGEVDIRWNESQCSGIGTLATSNAQTLMEGGSGAGVKTRGFLQTSSGAKRYIVDGQDITLDFESGADPASSTCADGAIFHDTDSSTDTNCTTATDDDLCACVGGSWVDVD